MPRRQDDPYGTSNRGRIVTLAPGIDIRDDRDSASYASSSYRTAPQFQDTDRRPSNTYSSLRRTADTSRMSASRHGNGPAFGPGALAGSPMSMYNRVGSQRYGPSSQQYQPSRAPPNHPQQTQAWNPSVLMPIKRSKSTRQKKSKYKATPLFAADIGDGGHGWLQSDLHVSEMSRETYEPNGQLKDNFTMRQAVLGDGATKGPESMSQAYMASIQFQTTRQIQEIPYTQPQQPNYPPSSFPAYLQHPQALPQPQQWCQVAVSTEGLHRLSSSRPSRSSQTSGRRRTSDATYSALMYFACRR